MREGADGPEDEECPCCDGGGVVGVQFNVCFAVDDNHGDSLGRRELLVFSVGVL